MFKRVLLPILVVMMLGAACSPATQPVAPQDSATATAQETTAVPTSTSVPEQIIQDTTVAEDTEAVETEEAACPGEAMNSIGQGIADEYEFARYEEVMSWFCDGAEFEDILVALQTEDQTGIPAEEMLVMLVDGLSWEDVWLVVGLME